MSRYRDESRRQSRYGSKHRWLRKRWARQIANNTALGTGVPCWRCRKLIKTGDPWDLGHYDSTEIHAGPECITCNRATAGRDT